eukprot:scaffold11562_cov72-Phaeocystis_antarctica.AAC.2
MLAHHELAHRDRRGELQLDDDLLVAVRREDLARLQPARVWPHDAERLARRVGRRPRGVALADHDRVQHLGALQVLVQVPVVVRVGVVVRVTSAVVVRVRHPV